MNEEDFEAYYDGPLELRPFLRAWCRDRWMRGKAFVLYRVLRRPRPVRAPQSAALAELSEMFKRAYSTEQLEQTVLKRSTFKAADLVRFDGECVMRCVRCGHEQPHTGPRAPQHCGEYMAPVDRGRGAPS